MPWIVKCWIPAEPEEDETYDTVKEATEVLKQAKYLQPENKYEIVYVDEDGEELGKHDPDM